MLTAGASVGPPSAVAAGAGGGARKPPTMLGVLSGMLECTVCFERPPANIYQVHPSRARHALLGPPFPA